MHEHTASHSFPSVTWILVADGKGARIYHHRRVERNVPLSGTTKLHYFQQKESHELVPVSDGILQAETIDDYQIGHQRRGTTVSDTSAKHNTYEPTGNTGEELKRRFAKTIAAKLERASTDKAFDRLILVAPAKMIGELREQLTSGVQHRIAAVLSKDLTMYDGNVLLTHLQHILAEAQVA